MPCEALYFFIFDNKKWVGGDLSWCILLECEYSDTLPTGLELVRVSDPDES